MSPVARYMIPFNKGICGRSYRNKEVVIIDDVHLNKEHIACSTLTNSEMVIPEKIFNVDAGELFVIRSPGNVVNDGELATIEYALEHLHIHYVLVLAHTSCGAVKASLEEEKGHYLNKIINRITLNIKVIKDYDEAIKENAVKTKEYILINSKIVLLKLKPRFMILRAGK